jgi:ABC-type transporter Mla subunit MlaD
MLKRVLMLMLLPLISLGCKADNLNLKIQYDQVHGLQKGDQVIFEQHPIGTVTGVSYRDNGDYLVSVDIKKDFNAVATEHSRFFIADDPVRQGHKAIEVSQIRPGGSFLKNQATVEGSTRASLFFDQIKGGFEKGLGSLKQKFEQFSQELSKVSESEAFKKLENELKDLAGEIEQSGQAARKEIEQQWLPRFKQELEKLEKRLRKLGREDELKPLEIELERIKTYL